MTTTRKTRRDSLEGQKNGKNQARNVVPLPDGFTLDTEAENRWWQVLTQARNVKVWREFDLVLLHKAVKLETTLAHLRARIDAEGHTIFGPKDRIIPHPLVTVADRIAKEQLSIFRLLSLGVLANAAAEQNRNGVTAQEAQDAKPVSPNNVRSLLAR